MSLIEQGVHRVASKQRIQHIAQVPNSISVVLLGLGGIVVACKAHHEVRSIGLTCLDEPFFTSTALLAFAMCIDAGHCLCTVGL